jgi:hypothetical protein
MLLCCCSCLCGSAFPSNVQQLLLKPFVAAPFAVERWTSVAQFIVDWALHWLPQ